MACDSLRLLACTVLISASLFRPGLAASSNPFDVTVRPLEIGDQMPNVAFVDQRNQPFTFSSAKGLATLVGFIYTHCTDVCPLITQKFGQLNALLGSGPYRLIEVTIDPEHDTQPVLATYAHKYGINAQRWSVVTGDPKAIARFARSAGEAVVDNGHGDLIHSARLLIVAPDGRLADVVQLAAWEPATIAAQLKFVAGTASNPLARADFALTKTVAQFCGGSYQVASGIIDVIAALLIVAVGTLVLVWMRKRLFEQGA